MLQVYLQSSPINGQTAKIIRMPSGVEAAVPEEDPFAEAETQTELSGGDMDMYTKKVGGLDEALKEVAVLKLERMRLQQVRRRPAWRRCPGQPPSQTC
jgi:hypothetical protein